MPDQAEDRPRSGRDPRLLVGLALVAGLAAVGVAMAAGLAGDALQAVASPAPIVRAGLAGFAIVLGVRWLLSALRRIDQSMQPGGSGAGGGAPAGRIPDAELGTLVRGVRLVFLAAACFAAAAGWLIGHPLPIVIALVIAGVDVVETSFLLLVAGRREP